MKDPGAGRTGGDSSCGGAVIDDFDRQKLLDRFPDLAFNDPDELFTGGKAQFFRKLIDCGYFMDTVAPGHRSVADNGKIPGAEDVERRQVQQQNQGKVIRTAKSRCDPRQRAPDLFPEGSDAFGGKTGKVEDVFFRLPDPC